MPTVGQIFEALEPQRKAQAARAEQLAALGPQLEEALRRELGDWLNRDDAVTGRRFVAIESVEGFPMGKRVRLFNKHFVEFLVAPEGVLVVRTSAKGRTVYDGGFTPPGPGSNEFNLWQGNSGRALGVILASAIGGIVRLHEKDVVEWGDA